MVFRKKRKGRRRTTRRKPKRRRINSMIVRGPQIVPDKLFTTLKYSDLKTFTGTGLQRHTYRGNSLFDPDFTGGGTQPLGFDQWATFYSRYKVHSASLSLRIMNISTSQAVQVVLVPTITSLLTSGNIQDVANMPYARSKFIQIAGGNAFSMLRNNIMTKVIRGENIRDDDYSALITSNPIKQYHWHIAIQDITSLLDIINVTIQTQITFKCEFFRRVDMVAS